MRDDEAEQLIRVAVERGGTWADLGAGRGTFTRALSTLLGGSGRVIAIERDRTLTHDLQVLASSTTTDRAPIDVIHADITRALELPPLDGALIANALHYVPAQDQASLLERLYAGLRPNGTIIIIEYEDRAANRWVPYPVSSRRLRELARDASLGDVCIIGTRASDYGGSMYAATIARGAATNDQRAPTS